MANTNPAHIVLRNVRLSYVHLDKPWAQQPGAEPKYSTTILVPKNSDGKAKIDAAVQAATQAAIAKHGRAFPANPATSVHDGDGLRPSDNQPYGEECRGCWVFTASSKQPVSIVDINLQPILDPTEIYSGMYANVGITFFGYSNPSKKGIGVGLENIQKIGDGEPLGGNRASVEDDFAPVGTTAQAPAYNAPPAQYYQQPVQQGYAPTPVPEMAPAYYQQPDAAGYPPQNNY